MEPGIAEGEDPSVGGHEPVPLVVGCGRHPHDGLVEVLVAHGSEESGVTEGEEPAVGRRQPVALAVGSCSHPDDGLVERDVPGGPVEPGIAVGEDPAVGGDLAVAGGVGRRSGGHADHRFVQVDVPGRPVEVDAAECEHAAVAGYGPVRRDGDRWLRSGRRGAGPGRDPDGAEAGEGRHGGDGGDGGPANSTAAAAVRGGVGSRQEKWHEMQPPGVVVRRQRPTDGGANDAASVGSLARSIVEVPPLRCNDPPMTWEFFAGMARSGPVWLSSGAVRRCGRPGRAPGAR